MGARNNIIVHQPTWGDQDETQPLYLYSHWHGQELDKVVMSAIEVGHERLDDPVYFTRILFNVMTAEDYVVFQPEVGEKPTFLTGTKGFGIGVNGGYDQDMYEPIHVRWRPGKNSRGWDTYEIYFERMGIEYTASEFSDAAMKDELPLPEYLRDMNRDI